MGTDRNPLGQVALTLRYVLKALYHVGQAERGGPRGDHGDDHQGDQASQGEPHRGQGTGSPRRVYIFDVDSRPDDPAPRREAFYEGEFRYRPLASRLRPGIVDVTAIGVGLRYPGTLNEESFSNGILKRGQVGAFHLWLQGMHDHRRMVVIDPEIVAALVAHGADGSQRPPLSLSPTELSFLLQLILVLDNGVRNLY